MRVLQVLEASLGGTRRYLEDVSDALGDGSHNGLAYSLHRADGGFLRLLEKLRRANWSLFEIDMRREIRPLHDAKCTVEMRRIYRLFQPDVVHAHSSKAGALSRLATLGMRRRPGIVYAPHSIAANVSRLYGLIEKVLALRLDIITAVTPSERDELIGLGLLPPERIHVVVPAIPSATFAPRSRAEARSDIGLGAGPLVVGVGRLTPQKDPLAFVELAGELRRRVPGLRAIWVGDGELRRTMEERIVDLDLQECVSIAGWLEDVRPYLAAADLFVSTSRYESFGYVTAEALAMERPVVATQITGTVDVVRTDAGAQLFPLDDRRAAVQRAVHILTNPDAAARIAQRGRASVNAAFSVDATRRGLQAAYDAALLRGAQTFHGVRQVEPVHIELTGLQADAAPSSRVG
jgi:glycosyltransferase involved in cell wall biosynthesis